MPKYYKGDSIRPIPKATRKLNLKLNDGEIGSLFRTKTLYSIRMIHIGTVLTANWEESIGLGLYINWNEKAIIDHLNCCCLGIIARGRVKYEEL